MKFLNEHIKNHEFKPVYLIYGEEAYLKKQYRDRLKTAIVGDDNINYSYYEGKKPDIKAIISSADTLPFFADKRLIIIEDSGLMKTSCEELAEYIKNIPDYLIIIFIEEEIDKRNKLYKAVNEKGYVSEMKFQTDAMLMKWIESLASKEGKRIDRSVIEYLLTKAGIQMDNVKQEFEKLVCYTYGRDVITRDDVDEICSEVVTNKIFDMITAMAQKRQKQALDMYYDLLMLKEAPMRILFLITRQFNMMLQVKEMAEDHLDNTTIARNLGIAPFLVGKYITQSKSYSSKTIRLALTDMAETEEAVKTGNLDDKTGVELIIVKYSRA